MTFGDKKNGDDKKSTNPSYKQASPRRIMVPMGLDN